MSGNGRQRLFPGRHRRVLHWICSIVASTLGPRSSPLVHIQTGWVQPPAPGFPQWGPDMDFNVQWETQAAEVVAATARLTLVTLPASLHAYLRRDDLPRLVAAGPLGELLARQGEANQMEKLGLEHSALPDDLLNFHYDTRLVRGNH
jgi:hypothetical protein